MTNVQKKLRIGWFTFTCCEDSTIIFTELLNEHYRQWLPVIDFVHFKTIQSNNRWEPLDVAFIEGAITSALQEEKVKKIREIAQKVVAIGACACIGSPSNQRNMFDEKTKEEIAAVMARFKYAPTVKKLSDIIAIDYQVQGCPMNEQAFLTLLNNLLKEFNIL